MQSISLRVSVGSTGRINMVVIFIELSKSDETIWFENPFKGSTIRLIGCSFPNHMCNLPSEGMFTVDGKVFLHVPKGNYTTLSLKHIIETAEHKVGETITNPPIRIIIKKSGEAAITSTSKVVVMTENLVKLMNLKSNALSAGHSEIINIIQPPKAIMVHCDLIDSRQVSFNGKYQHLLSVIDVGVETTYHDHGPCCGDHVRHLARRHPITNKKHRFHE